MKKFLRAILGLFLIFLTVVIFVNIVSVDKKDSKPASVEEYIQKTYQADSVSINTDKSGAKHCVIVKTIDGSLYGLMKESALGIQGECRRIIEEKLFPSGSTIKFISKVGLVDKYGKEYKEDAIEFVFNVNELNKVVNWNNLLPQGVLNLAISMKATPVGWEIMGRQLKRDPDDYKDYTDILERMARISK